MLSYDNLDAWADNDCSQVSDKHNVRSFVYQPNYVNIDIEDKSTLKLLS